MNRRTVLRAGSLAALTGLAGCSASDVRSSSATADGTTETGSTETVDATATTSSADGLGTATGSGFALRWRYDLGAQPSDDPAVGDLVYLATDDRIVGLDPATGSREWTYRPGGSVAVTDDSLFVWNVWEPDVEGFVALDRADHARRWGLPDVNTMPVVEKDLAYVTSGDFRAVEAATGRERWRIESGTVPVFAHAIGPRRVYLRGSARTPTGDVTGVHAVDIESGAVEWRVEDPSPDAPVSLDDDTLYVGSQRERDDAPVIAVDVVTGEERWRVDPGVFFTAPRGVLDGLVLVDSHSNTRGSALYALDAVDGTERWVVKGADATVIDGTDVYLVDDAGVVSALDIGNRTKRWTFDPRTVATEPAMTIHPEVVAHDGVVYVLYGETFTALDAANGIERGRFSANRPLTEWNTLAENGWYLTDDRTTYALDGPT